MSLVVAAMLALSSVGVDDPAAAARNGDAEAPARDGELEAVARAWLEQAERGDWRGSYDGTADSFRSANTLAGWQAAAGDLQERLGKVVLREAVSFDSVPTPPNGSEIVRFRTVYEKGGTKVETVALAREGSAWKIVGCYVE